MGGTDESKKHAKEHLQENTAKFLVSLENFLPKDGFMCDRTTPGFADFIIHDFVSSPFPGLVSLGVDMAHYPKLMRISNSTEKFNENIDSMRVEDTSKDTESSLWPEPELFYFNFPGRANLTRLIFEFGKVN